MSPTSEKLGTRGPRGSHTPLSIAGIRVDPDGEWIKQIARNLTDAVDGFLLNASYLDGQLIAPSNAANCDRSAGSIRRRARLGGLLSFYYREAA